MSKKHHASREAARPVTTPDSVESATAALMPRALGWIAGVILGRFTAFYGAIFLGIGGVVLSIAWHAGPQKYLDARKFETLTARAPAHIVESWLAVEFDPRRMGTAPNWRPFAKAAPCVVVEYDSGWTGPARRAFCGTRHPFYEHYTLHDIDALAPGVPFSWMRDERGFITPEIRMTPAAKAYLESRGPTGSFMPDDQRAGTELSWLRFSYDRPDDNAIAGWGQRPPDFTVAIDPSHPANTWPAGFIADLAHRSPDWFSAIAAGLMGLVAWIAGWRIIAGDRPWPVIAVAAFAPLLFLPWWGEQFPRWIQAMNSGFGEVIADMAGDVDGLDRLVASSPEDATLIGGERIVWRTGQDGYAKTFGAMTFKLPEPPPQNADAALDALADSVAAQMRARDDASRAEIFARLAEDKRNGHAKAGYVFLRAARDAFVDRNAQPAVHEHARRFLEEWVTQPVEEPWPKHVAFATRVRLLRELMAIPPPNYIAIPASWIVDRAQERRATPP